MIYSIQTWDSNKQFEISHIDVSYEDYHNGNPYNTTFDVKIISGSFVGLAGFEYNIKEFIRFVHEIKELYDLKRKNVELHDICYGSLIQFSLDDLGHVNVSGTVYGEAMEHSLTFTFGTDQTALSAFCDTLYRDFITNNNSVKKCLLRNKTRII